MMLFAAGSIPLEFPTVPEKTNEIDRTSLFTPGVVQNINFCSFLPIPVEQQEIEKKKKKKKGALNCAKVFCV